jgi:hypothetical protein
MVKIRYAIPVFAAIAALLIAGCGSSDSSSGGSELANFASPGSLVFAEGQLQPKGELKQNADSVAKAFTGGEGLGAFVISELESSARQQGESFDFAKEVEPWLGKEGSVAFERLVHGELSEPLIAVQTTDATAAQSFVNKRTKQGKHPAKAVSYEGVEFEVGGPEDNAVGLIGKDLVLAQSEKEFKAAVDASSGESLGDEDRFQQAIANASGGSLADIYVDVGGVIAQSDEIDPPTKELLQDLGVDSSETTAVASVIPRSAQIEIDLSSELGGEKSPSGDVSDLLGSLPARSFAAFGFSGFNEQLQEAVDSLDESGLPPELKPHELKTLFSDQAGIDLDKIVGSIEDAALFLEGSNRASLGGAMVITCKNSEAAEAVSSLGALLEEAAVPGVRAVEGRASGFSLENSNLGPEPLVILGEGKKLLISYGFGPLQGVVSSTVRSSAPPLSSDPSYKAAVAALGKTPISAFIDGPDALHLAEALIPHSKTEFWDAQPYLKKISYIGIGNEEGSEIPTAKLIAGVRK